MIALTTVCIRIKKGLRGAQMEYIPGMAVRGWNENQTASFVGASLDGVCSGFTVDHITNFTESAFRGFPATCVELIQLGVLPFINSQQLAALQPQACSGNCVHGIRLIRLIDRSRDKFHFMFQIIKSTIFIYIYI